MTNVERVDSIRTMLSVPLGTRVGFFLDDSLDCLKLHSVVNAIRDPDGPGCVPPIVVVPTYPMVVRGHHTNQGDLIFQDTQSHMTRVLYWENLHGPLQGVPWVINRAAILPTYLYDVGAAPCFDICFVFCEQAVGEEVVDRTKQLGTETVFISLQDLRSIKL